MCRDNLESYTNDYTVQVLICYFTVYIFMQTFMIPGTVFMSILAGALFGIAGGMVLVILAATAGASSCYFLSKIIGRPLVFSLWPDKLSFFQAQVKYISPPIVLWQPCTLTGISNLDFIKLNVAYGYLTSTRFCLLTILVSSCSMLNVAYGYRT